MRKEDILKRLYEETESIKTTLPDKGRRFEVIGYVVTKEMWDILMEDKNFADSVYSGVPNLGGIVIEKGDKLEVKFVQYKKGQKWFGEKK